tara:strand:+ start:4128 stop:4805 length:678 start_codon:yes stop_codon:yes gene_type:complete
MAYGMRPEELAAVGKNVNQQGGGVDEGSIQEAMDAELDEDRKSAISRNKARQNKARIADAETKAAIKQQGMDAIKTIAVEGAGAVASSDKFQANRAAGKEARLGKRADRMVGRGADAGKIEKVRTRSAEAGFKAAKLNPTKYGGTTKAYGAPGSLYGAEPPKVDVGRAAGVDAKPAQFKQQAMSNRSVKMPTTSKGQYMKASNTLAELKSKYPEQYATYMANRSK